MTRRDATCWHVKISEPTGERVWNTAELIVKSPPTLRIGPWLARNERDRERERKRERGSEDQTRMASGGTGSWEIDLVATS